MNGAVYYPQAALDGFGYALGSKLGVDVRFTTGQPRTDGTTIYLPTITGAITAGEFEALCGIAVHEAAHVHYSSVGRHRWYAKTKLRASCFNAVIDVADETRIEKHIPSGRDLLRRSNLDADARIVREDSFNTADPVWAILAAGILWNRLGRSGTYQRSQTHKHLDLMLKAYGILKKARDKSKSNAGRQRTKVQ